jgi:hypothetical protein
MRPVFFISSIQDSIGFYVDKLGFIKKWHEADGEGTVCQVDRGGCEIILCQDTTRSSRSRVFLELSRDGVDQLLKEIADRSVPTAFLSTHFSTPKFQLTQGGQFPAATGGQFDRLMQENLL